MMVHIVLGQQSFPGVRTVGPRGKSFTRNKSRDDGEQEKIAEDEARVSAGRVERTVDDVVLGAVKTRLARSYVNYARKFKSPTPTNNQAGSSADLESRGSLDNTNGDNDDIDTEVCQIMRRPVAKRTREVTDSVSSLYDTEEEPLYCSTPIAKLSRHFEEDAPGRRQGPESMALIDDASSTLSQLDEIELTGADNTTAGEQDLSNVEGEVDAAPGTSICDGASSPQSMINRWKFLAPDQRARCTAALAEAQTSSKTTPRRRTKRPRKICAAIMAYHKRGKNLSLPSHNKTKGNDADGVDTSDYHGGSTDALPDRTIDSVVSCFSDL